MGAAKSFDSARAKMLSAEIGKVRCWLTGYHAGRAGHDVPIAGEDSLRQTQLFLGELLREEAGQASKEI